MSGRSTMLRRALPGLAAIAVILTGCGNDDDSGTAPDRTSEPGMPGMSMTTGAPAPGSETAYNDADVTFLQMMYPHHAQAVEMADLVPTRSQNQQVLDLAAGIKNAQDPEMTQISALLQRFGKPSPTADPSMGHGMPGMMSQEQMSSLAALSGPDFDRMWLEMMISHHTGAIDMAETEQATGQNPEAKKLADSILSSQQSEIDQMKAMLGQN
ncbi:DUF305 domain-containing protein [Nocardia abscessus]|uniref:DUF305 domain-containing protein n=1 Tax=Nocardia abscessus TaxID=120957 RepID=UPI002455D889|nr:DUF305 domain-containing protein [Nocardia abscessus]